MINIQKKDLGEGKTRWLADIQEQPECSCCGKEMKTISLCKNCNCMTNSIQNYKEILKPKYKKINYIICGKCRKEKGD